MNGAFCYGEGSAILRSGTLMGADGAPSQAPIGSTCSTFPVCWTDDSFTHTLFMVNVPGSSRSQISPPYWPAGIACDTSRNRLFVADPVENAIQVYNATTLAFEPTITSVSRGWTLPGTSKPGKTLKAAWRELSIIAWAFRGSTIVPRGRLQRAFVK